MERLTNDLFKPLTQAESKRLVGGVQKPTIDYSYDVNGNIVDAELPPW
jgi:hypothetical protein